MELLLPIYVIPGYGYPILLRIADGILGLHTTEFFWHNFALLPDLIRYYQTILVRQGLRNYQISATT